ncbi:hypothetical protein, partial [Rhodococcus sp. NPDC058514]|uniref:hypothetical protein n=1 Tax=Rhodococcus sp. NPDC058514 TaxID=3346532 RepID=UPI00364C19D2
MGPARGGGTCLGIGDAATGVGSGSGSVTTRTSAVTGSSNGVAKVGPALGVAAYAGSGAKAAGRGWPALGELASSGIRVAWGIYATRTSGCLASNST